MSLSDTSYDEQDFVTSQTPIELGVSACLMGEKVRYDGGHKKCDFLLDKLLPWVNITPFCPEVKAGLGIPRPAIRLAQIDSKLRVVGTKNTQLDVTEALNRVSDELCQQASGLTGFLFCARSPSCGMERVKVYDENGNPLMSTRSGIFADKIRHQYPLLPCEENGRLNDELLKNSFLTRLFCFARWQAMLREGLNAARLLDFHCRHKYLLLAHSQSHYREAGQSLANLKAQPIEITAQQYLGILMSGLTCVATRKKHVNVLMHLQGYFKNHLGKSDKAALTEMILRYQKGLLPLASPIEILKYHLRHYPDDYLQIQYYFSPFPAQLNTSSVI